MTDLKMTAKRVDRLLFLAMATAPQDQWQIDHDNGVIYCLPYGVRFDPANNSEQFVEVLAWIEREIGEACGLRVTSKIHAFNVYPYDDSETVSIEHNGTTADIRRAVVEAAIRVANA